MYQKEIIYMGLYRDGSRLGSAGFLKVENRERESRLHLKIQNIPLAISGRFPIRVHNGNGWKEINGITVQDGGGSWEEELAEASDSVILQVILPGGHYLEGRSRTASGLTAPEKPDSAKEENAAPKLSIAKEENAVEKPDVAKEENVAPKLNIAKEENAALKPDVAQEENAVQETDVAKEKSAMPKSDVAQKESVVPKPDVVKEENVVQKSDTVREENIMRDTIALKKEAPEREPDIVREGFTTRKKRAYPETILIKEELPRHMTKSTFTVPQNVPEYNLKEDKWEQILDTYENIHPYGDERVYVKLEPKDFVILQSKYQHLVNNSFLLHGFYNYRYIILGKEQDYYLGVPGVFYEREKMVALMFGFEAFECPSGNVKAGEFGYYLRKVEL